MKRRGLPALSLWNPHAGLMAIGSKAVESRGQKFGVMGPLAIASTVGVPAGHRARIVNQMRINPFPRHLAPRGWTTLEAMPRGCILALVWVLSEIKVGPLVRITLRRQYGNDEMDFGFYDDDRVAITTDPERRIEFHEPVACTGKQGVWYVDAAARAKIRAQIEGHPNFHHYRHTFDTADAADSPPTRGP